jgi:hypothetical protein
MCTVASEYTGTDANGSRWFIAVRGANILVHAPGLTFTPELREQFARAWIAAEHEADAAGAPAVVTTAALVQAGRITLVRRMLDAAGAD